MDQYRVGHCSKCNERVWLTPSGACSRGHGIAPVTNVESHPDAGTPLPKTVYCRSCGAELFETVPVCGNCGTEQAVAGAQGGSGSQASGQAGPQASGDFRSQQWTVSGSVVGASASATPKLTSPPDFSALDPYYQDEFRRIYESGEMYKGRWNWAAFLFGPFWMLARDMPMIGLIVVAANILVGAITAGAGVPGLFLAYAVYVGVRGNYLRYTALYKRVQVFFE